MAEYHIPMDDVKEIWNQMPEKNWSALKDALDHHWQKAEGIDNTLVGEMHKLADQMESSGEPFPQNPDDLYRMLNQG